MIYILPGVLFFSYQPLISLGTSESMNFELSLPLVWLVVFDILVLIIMGQKKILFKGWKKKWVWLLFPIFLTISILWSLNFLRGILTAGIVWLIYLAIDGFFSLKNLFNEVGWREKFWKMFFGSTLVICGWCWLQCLLDLAGVPREANLMCAGCTYSNFGFPRPDGFAIEPQFMGNLLLAPLVISGYFALKNKKYLIIFFILAATLFLTFSRGAIYALLVGLVVLTVLYCSKGLTRNHKLGQMPLNVSPSKPFQAISIMWGVVVLAFLFTLNAQGIMAQVSPTNDTYATGVAKVLNHLTLGIVDVREHTTPVAEFTENNEEKVVEMEDSTNKDYENKAVTEPSKEAAFDGYVAESTDTRLRLSKAAVEIWSQDLKTVILGVGLGGAGQALYVNNLSPAPKEIVQNQYVSLLLETGLIGIVLAILTLVLVIRAIWHSPWRVVLYSLLMAYGVTLLFFSGLPNALHIYLLPALFLNMYSNSK
ncbi:O-antigen ligase family protein [Candidatus Saccharibacteria bacterium]|nr:O-antigen ligase family protein [Candidatus Saccharibacteria bacterium]